MKLNNKGQSLIIFIIILPLILLFAAYVVDLSLVSYEKTKSYNIMKMIINKSFEHNYNETEIKNLIQENEMKLKNLSIVVEENEINIKNEYSIASIFGSIIGIEKYQIKIDITGVKKDNKIKYIKE